MADLRPLLTFIWVIFGKGIHTEKNQLYQIQNDRLSTIIYFYMIVSKMFISLILSGGTGIIASSSTFRPHPGRVIRDLLRLLNAVYSIVRKH